MLAANRIQVTTEPSMLQLVAQIPKARGYQWAYKGRRLVVESCYKPALVNPDFYLEHLVLGL